MKYLIVGPPRSGTTILASIVMSHPQAGKCFYEPFNAYAKYGPIKNDLSAVKLAADEILSSYGGIKEIVDALNPKVRRFLYDLPLKVIHTSRDNLARQAISFRLAQATSRWQFDKKSKFGSDFPAIGVESAKEALRKMQECKRLVEADMASTKSFRIGYEAFFLADQETQTEKLLSLFEFLEVTPTVTSRMADLLEKGRVMNDRDYLKIPNIAELERALSGPDGSILNGGLML